MIITPAEWALKELDLLMRQQGLEWPLQDQEKRKRFYFSLNEIFRGYLERDFGFLATDCTTEEILPHLKRLAKWQDKEKSWSQKFLMETDLVKFSDWVPEQLHPRLMFKGLTHLIKQSQKVSQPASEDVMADMQRAKGGGL